MIALKGKEYCKEDLFIKFSKAMLYSKWKRKKARFGKNEKKQCIWKWKYFGKMM
jgi:hypothetical protein